MGGTFKYNKQSAEYIVLTKEGQLKSHWNLPSFFKDVKISHHYSKSWKKDYFQSVARGQEFVIQSDENRRIERWVRDTIKNAT